MLSISNNSVTVDSASVPNVPLNLAVLPTLKLTISRGNRLCIERFDVSRNLWKTIYDALQPAAQNKLLEFDDLDLNIRVSTLEPAVALSFQTRMHVLINSEEPIVLQDDFIVGGNLQVTTPRLSNQARLTAESFSVDGSSFESTRSVRTNGLSFKVHDFQVSGSLYGQNLNGTLLYNYKIHTVSAEVQIKCDLKHSGTMKIIGSQVSTHQLLEGDHPQQESVFPYYQDIETYQSGEHRRKHTFHSDTVTPIYSKRIRTNAKAEVKAPFSVSSDLACSAVSLNFTGLSSALSMCLKDIHEGQIGHVALSFRLPTPPSFRPRISLVDYFQASAFVELQTGGDTVYKSLLGSRVPRPNLDPIIVLNPNRTVSHAVPGMRRLLSSEQK